MSDLVNVKIKTDTHQHQDKSVLQGAILEVDLDTARHFIAVGVADPVSNNDLKKEG